MYLLVLYHLYSSSEYLHPTFPVVHFLAPRHASYTTIFTHPNASTLERTHISHFLAISPRLSVAAFITLKDHNLTLSRVHFLNSFFTHTYIISQFSHHACSCHSRQLSNTVSSPNNSTGNFHFILPLSSPKNVHCSALYFLHNSIRRQFVQPQGQVHAAFNLTLNSRIIINSSSANILALLHY